jgi:hypothetical protein
MSIKTSNKILTSVKLPDELWDEFRISCVKHKFSLQKLTERSMYLYLNNETFRQTIHNQLDTTSPEQK